MGLESRKALEGLTGHKGKHLNGMMGEVVSFEDKTGRYGIRLRPVYGYSRILSLKRENIVCAVDEHSDSESDSEADR